MNSELAIGDRQVNRLGFGAMRVMGANYELGRTTRAAAVALVRRAVELGVDFIDTADICGDGENEEIIAAALHPDHDDVVIATKGSFVPGELAPGQRSPPVDCRPSRLREVCEASLLRRRRERIDLYQLHAPNPSVPFEESVGALVELSDEGKIAHIGLSNVRRRQLATTMTLTRIASVQNRYNHADRPSDGVLATCEANGIAFLPWGPIQTGDDVALAGVAAALGCVPQQAASAWLLHRSTSVLPIPGTSSISHLEMNLAAADILLDADQLATLNEAGAA